ncbi:MAG: helix-turn-helix domain-containing protein [Nitrososphaeraceae archaeon]
MKDPLIVLQTELKLSERESELFLHMVKTGRRSVDQISLDLNCSREVAEKTARSLVDFGMIIQMSCNEYTPLHPRFAIVNRYRERCKEDNIPFRRNELIDHVGAVMAEYYEHINV